MKYIKLKKKQTGKSVGKLDIKLCQGSKILTILRVSKLSRIFTHFYPQNISQVSLSCVRKQGVFEKKRPGLGQKPEAQGGDWDSAEGSAIPRNTEWHWGSRTWQPLLVEMHGLKLIIIMLTTAFSLLCQKQAQESHCPSADASSLQEMLAILKYWG